MSIDEQIDRDADFLVVMPLTKPRRRLEGDLHSGLMNP